MRTTKIDVRDAEPRERYKKARVYIFIKNENIIDNLQNRHSRPYDQYRKEVMPKVLKKMKLPKDTKFFWSQKAGCGCGCSPGFVIEEIFGKEVFVNVVVDKVTP